VSIAHPIAPGTSAEERGGRALALGLCAADLVWERLQEQAALAYRAGDALSAARAWEQTLAIAREHFGRGDPRLAASLTNQALVMRRRRQEWQAKQMFEEAFTVWAESWRWIHLMTPSRRATPQRERLEVYEPAARACFTALADRGCAATAWLERHDELLDDGLADWFAIKPRRFSDLRRLLAAVLLIAPKRA
jgi:hypothetical protein